MTYQVNAEKTIARPVRDVFQALKNGLLFMNCGADSRSLKIDFRVGGKYEIAFKNKTLVNFGEFLDIVPEKKIVFSWCQEFGADQKPDTTVTIELFPEGDHTKLVLAHTGFRTQASADNHRGGWTDGLSDFAAQIQSGKIRMVRSYDVPVSRLFEAVKNPQTFFAGAKFPNGAADARVIDTVPNEKIKISWLTGCGGPLKDSFVTLTFKQKDAQSSSVELIHEGLMTDEDQKAHRGGWEYVTAQMRETLLS